MRGQEIVAPSKRQRWGVVLVALVVAGVVVMRGGMPETTQAESAQPWNEEAETLDIAPVQWVESETGEVQSNDSAVGVRPELRPADEP